jgi:hypothetical protein
MAIRSGGGLNSAIGIFRTCISTRKKKLGWEKLDCDYRLYVPTKIRLGLMAMPNCYRTPVLLVHEPQPPRFIEKFGGGYLFAVHPAEDPSPKSGHHPGLRRRTAKPNTSMRHT